MTSSGVRKPLREWLATCQIVHTNELLKRKATFIVNVKPQTKKTGTQTAPCHKCKTRFKSRLGEKVEDILKLGWAKWPHNHNSHIQYKRTGTAVYKQMMMAEFGGEKGLKTDYVGFLLIGLVLTDVWVLSMLVNIMSHFGEFCWTKEFLIAGVSFVLTKY